MLRIIKYFAFFSIVGAAIFSFMGWDIMYGYLLFGALGVIFSETIKFGALSTEERTTAWWVFDTDRAVKGLEKRLESGIAWLKRSPFTPRYNEATLFLLAFTTLLTGIWYRDFLQYLLGLIDGDTSAFIVALFILWGLWLSIFHAVSRQEKTTSQKRQMAIFAAVINILIAYAMYSDLSYQETDLFYIKILPMWHLATAVYLFFLLRLEVIGAESVSDEEAQWWEIVIGSVAVLGIFFLSAYYFQNHWAITLSLCVAYTSTLNRAVKSFITFNTVRIDS